MSEDSNIKNLGCCQIVRRVSQPGRKTRSVQGIVVGVRGVDSARTLNFNCVHQKSSEVKSKRISVLWNDEHVIRRNAC